MTGPRKTVGPRKTTAAAQKREVRDGETSVSFKGHSYVFDRDIDLDVLDALSATDLDGTPKLPDLGLAVRLLLGAEQYTQWRSRHKKTSELKEFFAAVTEALNAGN